MTHADDEEHVDEKYGGRLHGPMSVRVWLRMLSCTTIIEKRLRRQFVADYGITLPRFDVLAALDRRTDGLTMGDLSQMLLVSNGNVTAIVRQLQGDGLVATAPADHDRRSLIVKLTPAGATYFRQLATAHHRWIADILSAVPEDVQEKLFLLLASVKQSIAASSGAT